MASQQIYKNYIQGLYIIAIVAGVGVWVIITIYLLPVIKASSLERMDVLIDLILGVIITIYLLPVTKASCPPCTHPSPNIPTYASGPP